MSNDPGGGGGGGYGSLGVEFHTIENIKWQIDREQPATAETIGWEWTRFGLVYLPLTALRVRSAAESLADWQSPAARDAYLAKSDTAAQHIDDVAENALNIGRALRELSDVMRDGQERMQELFDEYVATMFAWDRAYEQDLERARVGILYQTATTEVERNSLVGQVNRDGMLSTNRKLFKAAWDAEARQVRDEIANTYSPALSTLASARLPQIPAFDFHVHPAGIGQDVPALAGPGTPAPPASPAGTGTPVTAPVAPPAVPAGAAAAVAPPGASVGLGTPVPGAAPGTGLEGGLAAGPGLVAPPVLAGVTAPVGGAAPAGAVIRAPGAVPAAPSLPASARQQAGGAGPARSGVVATGARGGPVAGAIPRGVDTATAPPGASTPTLADSGPPAGPGVPAGAADPHGAPGAGAGPPPGTGALMPPGTGMTVPPGAAAPPASPGGPGQQDPGQAAVPPGGAQALRAVPDAFLPPTTGIAPPVLGWPRQRSERPGGATEAPRPPHRGGPAAAGGTPPILVNRRRGGPRLTHTQQREAERLARLARLRRIRELTASAIAKDLPGGTAPVLDAQVARADAATARATEVPMALRGTAATGAPPQHGTLPDPAEQATRRVVPEHSVRTAGQPAAGPAADPRTAWEVESPGGPVMAGEQPSRGPDPAPPALGAGQAR